MRIEVGERTLADGTILEAVDPEEVASAARRLIATGAEALAIVFVNAYANAANERAAAAAARAVWPNDHVAHSAEILPEIREFERASTTALNGYLQPVVASYLGKLEAALASEGFAGSFHVVQSNGGVMSAATARAYPVRTALSGPAAGVIAASAIATAAGLPDIVTADLGGTSFDVSLVAEGKPTLAAQTTIDFGMVVRTPMIEIATIGAGGGSIAHVDAGGLLAVGPESAGSRPGPVCYGQGNERPTLTDANVVLGRINAEKPIGGKLARLDVEAARAAILTHVGDKLGLAAEPAAEAILRVANARMAGAIRLVSVERGHDPAKFVAVPFGGGGALHVGALIREAGLKGALVPRYPGIVSALGCIIADIRTDKVETVNLALGGLDAAGLAARMQAAATETRASSNAPASPSSASTCCMSSTCITRARRIRSRRSSRQDARPTRRPSGKRSRRLTARPSRGSCLAFRSASSTCAQRPSAVVRRSTSRRSRPKVVHWRRRGAVSGASGSTEAGVRRRSGTGWRCPSALRSRGRRSWSSRTPRPCSILA